MKSDPLDQIFEVCTHFFLSRVSYSNAKEQSCPINIYRILPQAATGGVAR